jgi:uncharacterized protein (DUF1501 family)
MLPNRRDFLCSGAPALLACGTAVPTFLASSAAVRAAAPPRAARDRVLVVVQLDGGNDGLNTIVPYRDSVYRKLRPTLRVPAERVHKIDGRVGLHPALVGLERLLQKGELAVVQGVGYPNPNRSHFESMAIWHTARLSGRDQAPGWLARYLDRGPVPGGDAPALYVHPGQVPQALAFGLRQTMALDDPSELRRYLGVPRGAGARAQQADLDAIARQEVGAQGSLLRFVSRTSLISYTSSARLEALSSEGPADGYPEVFGLARRLRLISRLLKAGLSTPIYYTQLRGFDTHGQQLATHPRLLQELGASLEAFLSDLRKSSLLGRVLVLVFSEFGRRLAENASGGTDHGTTGPVLLLGPGVRGGLHGTQPDLGDLADGDPRYGVDFRRIYAAVLEGWLGCPSRAVLGGDFKPLPVLR